MTRRRRDAEKNGISSQVGSLVPGHGFSRAASRGHTGGYSAASEPRGGPSLTQRRGDAEKHGIGLNPEVRSFVSGHGFSRAASRGHTGGFSPCLPGRTRKLCALDPAPQGLKPGGCVRSARLKPCPDTESYSFTALVPTELNSRRFDKDVRLRVSASLRQEGALFGSGLSRLGRGNSASPKSTSEFRTRSRSKNSREWRFP